MLCLGVQATEIAKDIRSDPIQDWTLVVKSPLSITNLLLMAASSTKLATLVSLNLSLNEFESKIPKGLELFSKLEILDSHGNMLSGLPDEEFLCFSLDDKQITDLRHSIDEILSDKPSWNQDLFVATVKLLTSAAVHQPVFLVAIISAKDNLGLKQPINEASFGILGSPIEPRISIYLQEWMTSPIIVRCSQLLTSALDKIHGENWKLKTRNRHKCTMVHCSRASLSMQKLIKEDVISLVDKERRQALQTAQVLMNMLDATMPGTLMEEHKKKATVEDYKGIVLGGFEAAKHSLEKLGKISDGSSCSGVENSCNHSQRISGQIISDSDEEVDTDEEGGGNELFDFAALAALTKIVASASSDSGSITITSPKGSKLFSD
ncbi:hypothetical protein VitviT2T_015418 [Vitis vinifera]|uniref:DUF7750 domain-containing protein n=1 Tax=Vitis vinifera TaxID=29760 RepID=A0ABY9CP11_VITVI|nr:hypothetical protein VitviT2T_015418 [Vitis vinifera]